MSAVDLDYGIKDPQMYVFDEAQQIVLKRLTTPINEGEIVNPFFIPLHENMESDISEDEIKLHKRILILCLKNEYATSNIRSNISMDIITVNDFNDFKKYFVLVSCDTKLIRNKTHLNSTVKVTKELLEGFALVGNSLNNYELVTCISELPESIIRTYLSLYADTVSLGTLRELMLLYDYFRCSSYYPTKISLASIITRLKESNYFTFPWNCKISNTKQFLDRRFQYKEFPGNKIKASTSISTNDNETLSQLLNRLSKVSDVGIDYLNFLNKSEPFHENEVSHIQKYNVQTSPVDFTKDQMTQWFENIDDNKIKFNLFSTLCLSKDYCHLLINNRKILLNMVPLINKSMPFMRYIFGYTWLYMCMEEDIIKTRATVNDRFIFSIDTAAALPVFPYSAHDIHMNPYCSLLLPTDVIDYEHNFSSLPMLEDFSGYGIDTLSGFKHKFKIFTGNVFNNLEWDDKFAVSGSAILACSQKKNPLMDLVSTSAMSDSDRLERFFNEYYGSSDIDIMCNRKSIFDFMDCVDELIVTIKNNLISQEEQKGSNSSKSQLVSELVNESIKVKPVKSVLVIVTQQYIEKFMKEFIEDNFGEYNPSHILDNINENIIKEHFLALYVLNKIKLNTKYRKINRGKKNNALYDEHYKMLSEGDLNIIVVKGDIVECDGLDSEMSFMHSDLVDEDDKEPDPYGKIYLKIIENIKFKITSKYMKRGVEVFRIKFSDFFSCVARFHLNCVRGFYDGNDVKLLPSCITALMTGINLDYKYFSGQRDPIVIMNKYRTRGQSVILNDFEKIHVAEYNGTMDTMAGLYSINLKNKGDVLGHFGPKTLDSKIFRPLQYCQSYPEDAYTQIQSGYVMTELDLHRVYKNKYGYDAAKSGINFLAYKTINKNGNVEPIKHWLLDAAYDDLF